jgi:sec-independent protein translocase protein TatA
MFSGIGIWEVLLIIVVVLIVLGPQRVPEIARKLGQIVRSIRRASTEFSTAITREIDVSKKDNSSPPKEKPNSSDISSSSGATAVGKQSEKPAEPEGQQKSHE